jgi:hypothetical protein
MKWMRERDALIAQTLAFVQSVTGRKAVGEPLSSSVPELPSVLSPPAVAPPPAAPAFTETPIGETPIAEAPKIPEPASPVVPQQPVVTSDLQRELQSRIASFRAHQERFNREREEYFSTTLARLRAAIKDGPQPGQRS